MNLIEELESGDFVDKFLIVVLEQLFCNHSFSCPLHPPGWMCGLRETFIDNREEERGGIT